MTERYMWLPEQESFSRVHQSTYGLGDTALFGLSWKKWTPLKILGKGWVLVTVSPIFSHSPLFNFVIRQWDLTPWWFDTTGPPRGRVTCFSYDKVLQVLLVPQTRCPLNLRQQALGSGTLVIMAPAPQLYSPPPRATKKKREGTRKLFP